MPETVTVPSTLSGHAADIWRKAFLSAYSGTCSERDDKDECAAKIAWSAVKKGYKKGEGEEWVAKAGDPVIGPISSEVDAQPPLAYDSEVLKPGAGTKMQRWKKAYNKALAEDCRQSDNPTECARAYANKAVGRVETDVEPVVEKTHVIGRAVKKIISRGGAGSGHFEHEGRPGEKGGSLPSGASGGRKPKSGEKGYNKPGSGTGHYERGEGYIGPDKPSKTGKEMGDRAKKAGLKPGESMPKASTLKGKEFKKWVKALATTNTLDQLREMQGKIGDRAQKAYDAKDDAELEEQQALAELYTNAVMYQNFPETRSVESDAPFDPLGAAPKPKELVRRNGKKYPLIRIRGGAGSGHHGHEGRPGEVGGSAPSGGGRGRVSSKAEENIKSVFDKYATHHSGVAQMLEAWDRAKGYDDLYEGVREEFNEPLAYKIVKIIDETDANRVVGYQREDPLGEGMKETHQKEMEAEVFQTGNYVVSDYEKKLDGMRRHKFLTKEIEKKLPALYSQEKNPDPTVWAKYFHPFSNMTWYATEYDPKVGMFFGYVDTGDYNSELGYFSRQEMAESLVRGLPIERDKWFTPTKLSEITGGGKMSEAEAKFSDEFRKVADPFDEEEDFEERSLRGEVSMDENPLKLRVDKKVLDGYVKRAEVRKQLNDVDYALIERMGDQEIIRPDRFSSITWRTMPPSKKNVRAEATRRIVERNYAQAVEDCQMAGWKAKINHYQPDEYYFAKSHDTEAGPILIRGVLVRRIDSVEWKLKPLSQFATNSIAVQLPDYLLRHNKEQLLKLPVLRGGPGSGHHGHRGRQGEVGGSEPSGAGGKRQIAPDYDFDAMAAGDIPETDDELYDMLDELGLGDMAPDRIREPKEPKVKAPLAERLPEMSISQIAGEIRRDWSKKGKGVNYAAKPYLEAMNSLESLDDMFYHDSGRSVVLYFLSNARSWRGDTAKAVKAELNKRLKAGK